MTSFFDKVLRDPGAAERRPARRPWWQTAKTARQGFTASILFGLIGLAALLASVFGGARLWIAAVIWLPLAGIYLVSAVALRRTERPGATSGSRPGAPPPTR